MFDFEKKYWVMLFIILGILAIAICVGCIYVLVTYGNLPITEVPTWALWLL